MHHATSANNAFPSVSNLSMRVVRMSVAPSSAGVAAGVSAGASAETLQAFYEHLKATE